jgi:hypothetical protein
MTMIMKCDCAHDYQDKQYGKGNRLYNSMKKENSWRCTVCGKEIGNKVDAKKEIGA